jgi:hypothetical protein
MAGITLQQILDDATASLGVGGNNGSCISENMKKILAHRLNAALQIIYSSPGKESFYSETEEITLDVTTHLTGSYTLPDSVASILGPVRYQATGAPLIPIASRGEYDIFGPVYLGSATMGATTGRPVAYFVDSRRDPDDDLGDAKEISILFQPVPTGAEDGLVIELDVRNEPPRYTVADFTDNPTTIVPIPDQFAESILLPLVRMGLMTASGWISDTEVAMLPNFEREGQRALAMLGITDSALKTRLASNARCEEYPDRK